MRKRPYLEHEELDALVGRALAGDLSAFDQIVLAVQADLRVHLLARGAQGFQLDELLQETLYDAYTNLDGYRGPGTLRAWLKGIARNRLLRSLREQKRRCEIDGDVLESLVLDRSCRMLTEDPIDEAEAEPTPRDLQACLEQLPARSRTLVERRHKQDVPIAELAKAFKLSKQKIAYRLMRIRQQLRQCLERA